MFSDAESTKESQRNLLPSTAESPANSLPPGLANVLRNAASSTMGAGVVATVVTPMDVVKVRLQAHVCPVGGHNPCEDPKHVGGSFDALRKIIRSDGIRGLWRGLNVTLLLAIPTTGIYFTLYEAFRERIILAKPDLPSAVVPLIAGAAARTAAASAASPLELARTNLQAGAVDRSSTVASVLRDLRRTHGVTSWWRGLGPTLLRDAPFSAIYWSAYEKLKHPTRSPLPRFAFAPGNEVPLYLASGIGAGGLAAFCTVPADVIKTRRQTTMAGNAAATGANTSSSFQIVREIMAAEGIRGLFRGAGPRVAKVAPACAIMMGTFETFRRILGSNPDNVGTA